MTRFPVFADGVLHPPRTPLVAAEDRGFQLGMAVFETLLVEDAHAYFLAAHIARLVRGAAALGVDELGCGPEPSIEAGVRAAVAQLVAAVEHPRYALRITVSSGVPEQGARLIVTGRTIDAFDEAGVVAMISSYRAFDDGLANVKATSRVRYVVARDEAIANGAWEALFLNPRGELAEGTVSNVFVVLDGELVTPPIDGGCLGGIVRERVLSDLARHDDEAGSRCRVATVTEADLARASEVFLTNTTGLVVPVRRVLRGAAGALELPGAAGPVQAAVRARLRRIEAADRRGETDAGRTA